MALSAVVLAPLAVERVRRVLAIVEELEQARVKRQSPSDVVNADLWPEDPRRALLERGVTAT